MLSFYYKEISFPLFTSHHLRRSTILEDKQIKLCPLPIYKPRSIKKSYIINVLDSESLSLLSQEVETITKIVRVLRWRRTIGAGKPMAFSLPPTCLNVYFSRTKKPDACHRQSELDTMWKLQKLLLIFKECNWIEAAFKKCFKADKKTEVEHQITAVSCCREY